MKKFLFAIPALALVLTACGSTGYDDDYEDDYAEEQYVPVCIDPETEERLPDSYCAETEVNDDGSFLMGAILVYMLVSDYPKVGKRAYDYKTKKPSGVLAKPSKNGFKAPKVSKPKSNGGSGYKPKSSGGGSKSFGGGGGFKSGGKR